MKRIVELLEDIKRRLQNIYDELKLLAQTLEEILKAIKDK